MLSRRLFIRWRPRSFHAVVIAEHDHGTGIEGVIERVHRVGRRVQIRMLLSDGAHGRAQVELQDWDWLELRVGDIVRVTRAGSPRKSAMSLNA
jgi:hypothetical protein